MCLSVISGHSIPSVSSAGDEAGEKTTDAAQEGSKSVLVMSGGEGYIDFRMGEFASGDGNETEMMAVVCGGQGDAGVCVCRRRGRRCGGGLHDAAALPG